MKRHFYKKNWFINTAVLVFAISCLFGSNSLAAKQDKTAPTAPTNLRAVSVTDSSVSLAWNASTDKVGVTSYNIYRDNAIIGSSSTASYTVSGLKPSTLYKFYVNSKDAAGNISKSSNTLSVTTIKSTVPIPTQPPTPTPLPLPTDTHTLTPMPTPTPLPTDTPAPTDMPTSTPLPTDTPTPTSSPTLPHTPTLALTPTCTVQPAPTPYVKAAKIVGYYAAWSAYSGFTPDKIDISKVTHINYAFANIGSDLKIALGYPDIDPSNFAKLNSLKQTYPHLKTLISVGGWSWSGKFSDVALTDASRSVFAESCVSFMLQYGFDGIDIDWEYPVSGGMSTNVKRPEDKKNFTLLLQKLREKLDQRSLYTGKKYMLTIAGAAGGFYVNNTELGILHQYLDYGNIMTYDIHGTWDSYTDFNAPLYNNSDASPQYKWSVDSSINAWLKAGFPAEKLVMGIPFYGNKYTSVKNSNNGLYQTFSGGTSLSYSSIASSYLNAPGYIRYYHQQSMVPWLFNGSTFISYEDEQSIGAKAQYIKSKGLGGAMLWELSQDPGKVLLNSIYNGLQ